MVRVELDIALGLVEPEVRNDLVCGRFGAAVRSHSRDVELRRARRDVDDALRAARNSRGQSEELANQVEQAYDVNSVVCGDVLGFDGFGGMDCGSAFEAGRVGSAWNEDVNLADRLDDLGHAWEVGLGGGICLDFGVWVCFLKRRFRFSEDRFTALNDDDACDAGFGEGLGDRVAYASGCMVSVAKGSLHDKGEHTASSDEKSLALCIERAFGRRDTIIGHAVVGFDLGGPDLRDVLEVEGHIGSFALVLSDELLCRCARGR